MEWCSIYSGLCFKYQLNFYTHWTPLYYSLFYCFLDVQEYENGLKEEDIKAIADKKIALFKKFIEAGAKVKTVDKRGNTLLHYVVSSPPDTIDKGEFQVELMYDSRGSHRLVSRQLIELLLEHGLTLSDENNDGETPLDWATGGGAARLGGMGGMGMSGFGGGGFGGMSGGGMISPTIIPAAPGTSPAARLGF